MADDIELAPQQKSSTVKLIVIVLAGMLFAAGGTLGVLFALGILPPKDPASTATAVAVEEVKKEAVYVALEPAFTVNFNDEGPVRYLQVTLEAMTREPGMERALGRHMPVIRNDLMLVFSSKSSSELATREGKEALQSEVLASIQGILERETGSTGIEAVYFTSFVMQ